MYEAQGFPTDIKLKIIHDSSFQEKLVLNLCFHYNYLYLPYTILIFGCILDIKMIPIGLQHNLVTDITNHNPLR